MSIAALLAAYAVILFTGHGLVRWLLRDVRTVCWPEVIGLGWFAGTAALSGLLWVGGFFARGAVLVTLVSVSALALTVWLGKRAPSNAAVRWFPEGAAAWEKGATLLLIVPVVALAWQGMHETLHWDGILVWEVKARLAFQNGGALPPGYYSDAGLVGWSHPGYPLYLPMLELWLYLWLGEANQFWLKTLFPFFQVATLAVLWSAGWRLGGRIGIGALAAWLLLVVPRAVEARAGLMQGYTDLTLGAVYLAAVACVWIGVCGDRGWWRAAALFSAVLPWVKQEGLVLWGCFVVATAWALRRDWRTALALVLPGLATVLLWKGFLVAAQLPRPETFQPMNLATLQANLPRVPALLQRLGQEFLHVRRWTLLWPLALCALAILACQRRRVAFPLAIAVLMPLGLYLIPYVFTAIQPYEMHVETSIDRLVLQIAPLAALALVLVPAAATSSPAGAEAEKS